MIEYRNVDTSTPAGLKQAERLKANGWQIGRTGLFMVQMFRRKLSSKRKSK